MKNRIREYVPKRISHNFASVWSWKYLRKPSVRTKTESICQV